MAIYFRVFSRVIAALVGGYLLANVAAVALSYLLPGSKSDGVMVAVFVSFFIYVAAVIWVFSARTAWIAWFGLLISGLASIGIVYLLYPQALL